MSGGAFNYVYQKLDNLLGGWDHHQFDRKQLQEIISVMSELLKDCEWVESCDSTWDTVMAAHWYERVYNLCAKLEGMETLSKDDPRKFVVPPEHYPQGKSHCQYCGAEEEHYHKAFTMRQRSEDFEKLEE